MVGAPTNKNTFEGALIQKKGVKSKLTLRHVYDVCQFTEILWCPGRLCQIINTDLMVPRLCQFYTCRDVAEILWRGYGAPTMSVDRDFAEILWCPDYVNLQRFHGAPTMSIYRDFAEISCCPDYVNLQRFHGAPTMSIYRDFAEISCCPDYVNLQRFHAALTMSIYRDFMLP